MKFNDICNSILKEDADSMGTDHLTQQAMEILDQLKAKSPNAYDKLIERLNQIAQNEKDEYEYQEQEGERYERFRDSYF